MLEKVTNRKSKTITPATIFIERGRPPRAPRILILGCLSSWARKSKPDPSAGEYSLSFGLVAIFWASFLGLEVEYNGSTLETLRKYLPMPRFCGGGLLLGGMS